MAQIILEKLAHSYLSHPATEQDYALKSMDLVWEDGGAYALLGPSGCGKTTLLNLISGLLTPTKGRVIFDQQDVTSLPPEQRNIAQVFQFPVVYDTMTVAQNLAYPLHNRKVDKMEIAKRVKDVIEMLGLEQLANSKARGLSADTKQKVSLGRGLVRTDANAILFDEPLTVIDPHLKWQLRTELKKIHQQFEHTMIYVTHDQTEALTFADKVVVMLEGAVVQIGTPEELFNSPRHTFVGNFIGSPGMNIFPCELAGNVAKIGNHSVPLTTNYCSVQGRLELGIRPEFIKLVADVDSAKGLRLNIRSIEELGRFRIVRGRLDEYDINVIVPEGVSIPSSPLAVFDQARVKIYCDSLLLDSAQGQH